MVSVASKARVQNVQRARSRLWIANGACSVVVVCSPDLDREAVGNNASRTHITCFVVVVCSSDFDCEAVRNNSSSTHAALWLQGATTFFAGLMYHAELLSRRCFCDVRGQGHQNQGALDIPTCPHAPHHVLLFLRLSTLVPVDQYIR